MQRRVKPPLRLFYGKNLLYLKFIIRYITFCNSKILVLLYGI